MGRGSIGDLVGMVKDRDSSSWKCSVGSVEPLMRLMAMEPSTNQCNSEMVYHWRSVGSLTPRGQRWWVNDQGVY